MSNIMREYHDAPEAVIPQDPEVLDLKTRSTSKIMDVGVGPRRLGDMKASKFWMILGLICMLITGITIGGAVAGSLMAKNSRVAMIPTQNLTTSSSSSTTSVPSQTTSMTATITTISQSSPPTLSTFSLPAESLTPSTSCNANGTIYPSLYLSGSNGAVPPGAGLHFTKYCAANELVPKLASGYFYTFEDCIELCASINFWFGDRRCEGVTYQPPGKKPVNCWAVNETAVVPYVRSDGGASMAAILV